MKQPVFSYVPDQVQAIPVSVCALKADMADMVTALTAGNLIGAAIAMQDGIVKKLVAAVELLDLMMHQEFSGVVPTAEM